MKKMILTMLAIASMAGVAYAATASYVAVQDGAVLGTSTNAPTLTVKGSKGVKIEYVSETTGQGYVLGASHLSGTQTFGTSSGDTKVYKHDGTMIDVPATAPTGSDTVDFSGSGFAAM